MPSWGDVAQIITAVTALLAALISYRNLHSIKKVEHATNSMKDSLIEVARKTAHAEGVLQGRAEMKDENSGA